MEPVAGQGPVRARIVPDRANLYIGYEVNFLNTILKNETSADHRIQVCRDSCDLKAVLDPLVEETRAEIDKGSDYRPVGKRTLIGSLITRYSLILAPCSCRHYIESQCL